MNVSVSSIHMVVDSGLVPATYVCSPVSQAAPIASVTVSGNTLTTSPSGSVAAGAPVTLTETVSPATNGYDFSNDYSQPEPNGQVEFLDNGTVLGTVPAPRWHNSTAGRHG